MKVTFPADIPVFFGAIVHVSEIQFKVAFERCTFLHEEKKYHQESV